jgi:transcriptional regulator with XRE-family HTH domain
VSTQAHRYRAARVYAGLGQQELGDALGVDRQTVGKRESGEQEAKKAELIAVAHVCEVPVEFLLGGFPALGAEPTRSELRQRLEKLEESVRFLVAAAAGVSLTDLMGELTDETTRALLGLDDSQAGAPAPSSGGEDDATSEDDQALP